MSTKQDILARIHAANASPSGSLAHNYSAIPRAYVQNSQSPREDVINLFADRLEDYGAAVFRCRDAEIAGTIAAALKARSKSSLLIPRAIQSDWLPVGLHFVPDHDLSYEALDRSEGVLTTCALAIALTGTIVLRHSADEGRRALTLIPDYHLCIVFEGQVFATVPEAIRTMSRFPTHPLTTISGPSATADIEMTRIKGVHGPRTLDVVLVGGPD